MSKLTHTLLALVISAAGATAIAALLGRLLFLSSQAEVVKLAALLFTLSAAIWITLILAIRRKD